MGKKFLLFYIIICSATLFAQRDIKIISSDRNSIVIDYTPAYTDSTTIKINNQNYIKYELLYGIIPDADKWGEPLVPVRSLNIGVPSETGNTIQVISSRYKTVKGSLAPKPRAEKSKVGLNYVYETGSNYSTQTTETDIVKFGNYGMMRSMPVQSVIIMPVEYNAAQGIIKKYTSIRFRISFSGSQTISSKPAEEIIKGAIVNYSSAKYWTSQSALKLQKKNAAVSSVLASGTWVRFEAPTEGMYKITKSMLSSYGIDPSKVDPRTIKIYNNGGKVLPESITATRPSDLVENAILVSGESDGKFDDGDYILFYGRGNDFWDYDTTSGTYKRYYHPYSNQNYYWITSGGSTGKRMQEQASLSQSSPYVQTYTQSFAQWDVDEINIGKSGREYYGDNFSQTTTSRTYTTKLNGRLDAYPVKYNLRFINASYNSCGIEIDESSTVLSNSEIYGYGDELLYGVSQTYSLTYKGSLIDNNSLLKITFTPTSTSSLGYLDYYEIQYQQQLTAVNDNLLFFSKDTTSIIQYNAAGFSSNNIKIFNITNYSGVNIITGAAINGTECNFQAKETKKKVSRYFGVGNDAYLTPSNPTQMDNSNLHGTTTGAKFLIITNKNFDASAKNLATYKENSAPEKISTVVVDVDKIFNEFSCGMTDPTAIRDYIKYAYDNWDTPPLYVLFFGKGTYDAKDIEGLHNNFVPAYETQESLNQIASFTTDDYFVQVSGNDNINDLAYGRITVQNINDADAAVNKIIKYETQTEKGTWQNSISLVADDGWHGTAGWEGDDHTDASEILAGLIPSSYDLNKIYLAAYDVNFTSEGRKIPGAATAIINAINNGTLIMNYIGHGSPDQWADEDVFDKDTSISQLHNSKYLFVVSAACDFGWWDMTNYPCAAEELVLLNNAGCIASFASTRLAYSGYNHALDNVLFTDMLDSAMDTNNLPVSLGQAVFMARQIYYDANYQRYELFGDPTIRLKIPQYKATIDTLNGLTLSSAVKIKALSTTKVSGEIRRPDNSIWSDFNGYGILSMYNPQTTDNLINLENYPMVLPGSLISRENISITNGKFSTSFTVPRDTTSKDNTIAKNSKISLYFYNNNYEGIGYTNNVIVNGIDSSVSNNKIGPDIKIFFDDTSTTNLKLVNKNSKLIVKLYDQYGINTISTGIGHKLEGILNGDNNNPIDFTNYFTGDLNSGGKSGIINYKFNSLDPGTYTLKVSAWDVFNNTSNATVNFDVINGNGLVIDDIYNYPDPFASNTTFTFQQNLASPINVKIKVYTVAGRLIREIERYGITSKFVKVDWDGRDQNGDLIANGTYLYKVIVHSVDGQYSQSALGKLAKIR